MQKGWEWLSVAMRGGRLAEVAAASDPLDARTVRSVRRRVRRGQVAENPAGARLAVALAREQQRRFSSGGLVVLLVIAAAAFGFAVNRLDDGDLDAVAILFVTFGIWACWTCWRGWRLDATARRAEIANMRLLLDAGQQYPRHPPTGLLPISAASHVAGAILIWLIYDLSYGALTLAVDGSASSLGRIVGRGALWATLMVVFNIAYLRGQRERQSEKPTLGQRGTRA